MRQGEGATSLSSHFHSPAECNQYISFIPLKFSHKRYFLIQLRKFFLRRMTNRPFISASSIAQLCDIRILKHAHFARYRLFSKSYKSVFLKSDLVEDFLSTFEGRIRANVIVIGASDRNFDDFPFRFPTNVQTILCQNNATQTSRVFTLPIGLENRELGRAGLKKYHLRAKSPLIRDRVFVPPMSPTNPIRRKVILDCLDNPAIFDVQVQLLDEKTYFHLAGNYRFVLCLEGNGFENHRIWETLYRGGIPILLKTKWSQTLSYLNLPLVLVDSVNDIDMELLSTKDLEFLSFQPINTPELWTPFWKTVIDGTRALG